MNNRDRARFDQLFERVLEGLPAGIRRLVDEVPVIVEDRPSRDLLIELGEDPDDPEVALEFCGLHTGVPYTEESVEDSAGLPPEIRLFREGIVDQAGGWDEVDGVGGEAMVLDEIRVTLLHEIGHQFGLDEDDLDELGYQ